MIYIFGGHKPMIRENRARHVSGMARRVSRVVRRRIFFSTETRKPAGWFSCASRASYKQAFMSMGTNAMRATRENNWKRDNTQSLGHWWE